MEENHENEIQILETSVEEKEKYIANLEGRIIALENSKRSLEVENAQVREQSYVYQWIHGKPNRSRIGPGPEN